MMNRNRIFFVSLRLLIVITLGSLIQSCDDDDDDDLGNWVKTSPYGSTNRSGAVCFTIDRQVFIGLGYNPNTIDAENVEDGYFRDFYMFDADLDNWIQIASFPGELREQAVSFSDGTYGYVGLGYNRELDLEMRDFWRYDPDADVWEKRDNDFKGSARWGAVGFAIGGYGYVGTGFDDGGTYKGDFYRYDPANDEWTQLENFKGDKRRGAFAFVMDGKAYIGGGTNNDSYSTDFYRFDPDPDADEVWTSLEITDDDDNDYDDFVDAVQRYQGVAFVFNGKAYIGTGLNSSSSVTRTFFEFDPTDNDWNDVNSFEGNPRNLAVAFVVGEKAYVGTGGNGTSRYDDIWEWRPYEEYEDAD